MSAGTLGRRGALRSAGPGGGPGPGLVGRRARAVGPGPGTVPAAEAERDDRLRLAAAGGSNSQMLYLIDTRAQAFAVYRVDPTGPKGSGTVKLEAARQYRYDLKLSEYNNLPPEASAVEAMVKSMAK